MRIGQTVVPANVGSRPYWSLIVVAFFLITLLPFASSGGAPGPARSPSPSTHVASLPTSHTDPAVTFSPTSAGGPVTTYLQARNGSLVLNVTLVFTNVSQDLWVNTSSLVTWGGHPTTATLNISWGDGNMTTTTTNRSFLAGHLYVTAGHPLLRIAAAGQNGTTVAVGGRLIVTGGGGGSGGNSTFQTYRLGATNGSLGFNLVLGLTSAAGVGYLNVSGNVSGGVGLVRHNESYGDGYFSGGTVSNFSLTLSHTYAHSGNYTFSIWFYDQNGTTSAGSIVLSVASGNASGSGGYPLHVGLVAYSSFIRNSGPTTVFNANFSGGVGVLNYTLTFGDGNLTRSYLIATGNLTLTAYHTYASSPIGTNYTAGIWVSDSNGSIAYAITTVYPTYSWVNGSGNHSGSNQTPSLQLNGTNGTFHLVVNLTYYSNTTAFWFVSSGYVSGGTSPYLIYTNFRNMSHQTQGTAGGPLGSTTWFVYSPGNYSFAVLGVDSSNRTISLYTVIHAVFSPCHPCAPPQPQYPSPVGVVVAADPVVGVAPLGVTLSSYIQGGAPPFQVVWSTPGSSSGSNGTGLSIVALYQHPGWYPATAFVYNTTNAFGTVLVGFGSVWVDVLGRTSGNGSGNHSGNHSSPPSPPAKASSAGQSPAAGMNVLLLETLLVGAAVGALVGYVFSATRPRLGARMGGDRPGSGPPGSRL